MRVYVGTMSGVYRLETANGGGAAPLGLHEHRVWALAARANGAASGGAGDVLLAGTYGAGIFRSEDGGATWQPSSEGLTALHLRCLQRDPRQPDTLYAGCEPGRLFRSTDAGRSWQELTGFTDVPDSQKWFLPYSPRAGAVRNVYFPAEAPARRLASVEVGGLMDSEDGGAHWTYRIGPPEDVHFVTGDPAVPGRIYAAMGYAGLSTGSVLRSDDGGRTWRRMIEGYTRAIIVPPGQPDALLASPGPKVGREATITFSRDGGETWTVAADGITTPMPDQVEVFHADPVGAIWGVCAGGRLLAATPNEWRWRTVPPFGDALTAQSVAFAGER